jgi:phage head maturation protease
MEAKALDVIDKPKSDFRIFSAALTPIPSDDGKRRLRTVASSTVEDLGGDEISAKALEQMAATAKGMTIFRNHSYKVPDDILGSVEHAEIKHSGLDGGGKPIVDLMLDILVREDAKSVETYDAVKSGVKLGTSIGAKIIPDAASRKPDGGYLFDELQLLEASIVGIPQNPRSWVQYAMKAYQASVAETEEDEDTNEEFVTASQDASTDGTTIKTVWVETAGGDKVTVGEPIETQTVDEKSSSKKKANEPEITKETQPDPPPDEEIEAEVEDSEQSEESDESVEKDAEPDVLQAVASEMETPAQEVDETAPEHAEKAVDESAANTDIVTKSAVVLADLVKNLSGENVRIRKALDDATEARDEAVRRALDAESNMQVMAGMVRQLGDTPLGRKAVFAEQITEFNRIVSAMYSPQVAKMLENVNADQS